MAVVSQILRDHSAWRRFSATLLYRHCGSTEGTPSCKPTPVKYLDVNTFPSYSVIIVSKSASAVNEAPFFFKENVFIFSSNEATKKKPLLNVIR